MLIPPNKALNKELLKRGDISRLDSWFSIYPCVFYKYFNHIDFLAFSCNDMPNSTSTEYSLSLSFASFTTTIARTLKTIHDR